MKKKGVSFFYASLLLLAGASLLFLSSCTIDPDPPDRYALVYGVSDYGGGDNDLTWTTKDAITFAEKLKNKGFITFIRLNSGGRTTIDTQGTSELSDDETNLDYGFSDSDVKPATLEQIISDVAMISQEVDERSSVLFYFSSHGTTYSDFFRNYFPVGYYLDDEEPRGSNSNDEWIITYNDDYTFLNDAMINVENEWIFDNEAYKKWSNYILSDDKLARLVRSLPTTKNTVIIDACLSGGFIGSSYDVDTAPSDYSKNESTIDGIFGEAFRSYFDHDSADTTWQDGIVITASGEEEYSYEDTGYDTLGKPSIKHGFFTLGILEAFSKDVDNDGYISTLELYSYARAFVEENFNNLYNDDSDYLPRISGGAVDFVLFEAD